MEPGPNFMVRLANAYLGALEGGLQDQASHFIGEGEGVVGGGEPGTG